MRTEIYDNKKGGRTPDREWTKKPLLDKALVFAENGDVSTTVHCLQESRRQSPVKDGPLFEARKGLETLILARSVMKMGDFFINIGHPQIGLDLYQNSILVHKAPEVGIDLLADPEAMKVITRPSFGGEIYSRLSGLTD